MVRESTVKSLLTYLELDKQTIAIATYEIEQILDVVLNGRIEAKKDVEQLREESGMSLLEWLKRFIKEKIEKAGGETLETLLELKNVSKTIRGKKIIEGLSFDVRAGEIFGFLGPNGAGKTTTIRMIVGHMSITAGEIAVCGVSVKENFEKAARHIGAIVENPEPL